MADLFEAIKGFEGFSPRASWDYKQNSVGWGTRARYPGETIDPREADSRLQDEIAKAQSIVDRHAPNLDAGTRSALTSLTYNAGDAWTRSGLGEAVRSGDMDKARSLFVQYNKAGGQTLPGLVNRRQQEVAWIGNPDGPASQPMALGGPPQRQAPQVRGSTAMAGMEDNGWGSLIGRFANGINNAVMSPMFQSGAAMVNAGAEGKNIGAGFLAGGDAAATASKNQFALQEARRKMEQMQMQEQYLKGVDTNDPKWAGIDQRLIEMAKRTNNIGFLEEAAKAKIAADRQAYINPLDKQMKEAQLQQMKLQTPEYRARVAGQYGMTPGTPEFNAFVISGQYAPKSDTFDLEADKTRYQQIRRPDGGYDIKEIISGKPKQDATTKKAIDEADDFVAQTHTAVGALKEALRLNDIAYDGPTAGARSSVVNGMWMVPKEGASATVQLHNVVTNQALQSLRATFGGNPTEGERKILLDVAGSVNMNQADRAAIYARAMQMAQQRLIINQQKAEALRTGKYYNPGGQPAAVDQPLSLSPGGGGADPLGIR